MYHRQPMRPRDYGTRPERPQLHVDQIIEVDEADYMYGVGPLRMRLIDVPDESTHNTGAEWWFLLGMRIVNDQEVEQVCPMVRVTALLNQPKPATPSMASTCENGQ